MTDDAYSGPERRKNLPTLELWKENIRALNRNNLSGCKMRYVVTRDGATFIMRFENEVPVGRVNFLFPAVDGKALVAEGWSTFVLTLNISDVGRLAVEMGGSYRRNDVTLEVRAVFARDIGMGVGIAADQISLTDTRDGSAEATSFEKVIEATMRSGDRRYARKDDDVRRVSVESIVGILTRFLKDKAARRRVLPAGE